MKTRNSVFVFAALISVTSHPLQAKARPSGTYLCTASYLHRHIQVTKIPDMRDENSVVDVISTFSADFSGSLSAGGGNIMEGRSVVEKDAEDGKDAIYVIENMLTDRDGTKLSPVGIYSNGDNDDFSFEVQFFNSKTHKPAGKEMKMKGQGVRITEVKANEYIQVSCSIIKRMKVNN